MIGSKGSEREFATVPVFPRNNSTDGIGIISSRKHQPYGRYYSNNEGSNAHMEGRKSNNSGCIASSPLLMVNRDVHNDEEDDVSSSVTVLARYRIGSPVLSGRASEPVLSTSPPFGWSANSSVQGEVAQQRFHHGMDCSTSIPVKSESNVCNVGSLGMRKFSANYASASFSIPPVLACSAPQYQSDKITQSTLLEPHAITCGLMSAPSLNGGTEYKSPLSVSISPSYHGDISSIRSPKSVPANRGSMRMFSCSGDTTLQGKKCKSNGTISDVLSSSPKRTEDFNCEQLKLCLNDDHCTDINDREHQQMYAHTCRLFPCYHGHVARHSKLFRHVPGQILQPEVLVSNNGISKKLPAEALASVNFSSISPDAPNAYRIIVKNEDQSYTIFGDWQSVRVHTFKRYLHQVCKIAPILQVLVLEDGDVLLDNDLEPVSHYGVTADSVIIMKRKEDADILCVSIEEK